MFPHKSEWAISSFHMGSIYMPCLPTTHQWQWQQLHIKNKMKVEKPKQGMHVYQCVKGAFKQIWGERGTIQSICCLSNACSLCSLVLAGKLGSFPTPPFPGNISISFPLSHLLEVLVSLWNDFSASWPLQISSAPPACTCWNSFPLICAMSSKHRPAEKLWTDCKGLISYQLWPMRVPMWRAPRASRPTLGSSSLWVSHPWVLILNKGCNSKSL